MKWRGRKFLYFGGCDYLRLSRDKAILTAIEKSLHKDGLTVSASRKTTGNHLLFEKLEKATAQFFGSERAVLVSNGYLCNLVVAQALNGKISHAFVDERSHSSVQDALKLLEAKTELFRHADADDLKRKLAAPVAVPAPR